jgi:hypothetical protein
MASNKDSKIRTQLNAFPTKQFRVTVNPRRVGPGYFAQNIGNKGAPARELAGIEEIFHTPEDIIEMVHSLEAFNRRGFDIYVTPISDWAHHYIVVDDVTIDHLAIFRAEGYSPALVQRSSMNNLQVVLVVPKAAASSAAEKAIEQSRANDLMIDINFRHGDKKITAVTHPFRLAGFMNKKVGRYDYVTNVVVATPVICAKATAELATLRGATVPKKVIKRISENATLDARGLEEIDVKTSESTMALDVFVKKWNEFKLYATIKGWQFDYSKCDFNTCKSLKAMGYSTMSIAYALLHGSPEINTLSRHANGLYRYIDRTSTRC